MKQHLIAISLFFLALSSPLLAYPKITRLEILPGQPQVNAGDMVRFTILAHTRQGTVFTPEPVQWEVQDGAGSIAMDGTFVAGRMAGRYAVTAQFAGLQSTAWVTLKKVASTLTRIAVSPETVSLKLQQGIQFTATGYDDNEQELSCTVRWQSNGGGIINATGYFRANAVGIWTVTASDFQGAISGSATVEVISPAPTIARLSISPNTAQLRPQGTMQFRVQAYDRTNRPVACSPIWEATGGQIDHEGYYQAGETPGTYFVRVRDAGCNVQARVNIIILGTQPQPQPSLPGRIEIIDWDSGGGNFLRPRAKITAKVYGPNLQSAKLFAVSESSIHTELQARSCKDGDEIRFDCKYDGLSTHYLIVQLFDNMGELIAQHGRNP